MHKKNRHPLVEYLREIVFGIQDGAIGNLGVVVGLAQATATNKVILLAGFATMLAQAISMSTGNYLSVKSEKEFFATKGKDHAFGRGYTEHKGPLFSSLVMAIAVIFGTAIPLLPFIIFGAIKGFQIVVPSTLIALFCVGVAKSKYTKRNWLKSGIEMFLIGSVAGIAGYFIGIVFSI